AVIGPTACRQPANRAARRRPTLYLGRSRRLSQPGDGPRARGRRPRDVGDPDRRLDCWTALGRALDAGPPRSRWLHRLILGQSPLRDGLSAGGGPATAVRRRPDVLAPHIHPRPSVRPAL